jgi:glycosyltransferase involved in cell wall biosynthesis
MKERDIRVLALSKYSELAASSRQRMVQYSGPLAALGLQLTVEPLLSDDYVKAISRQNGTRMLDVALGYAGRVRRLLTLGAFDAVWVEGDLLPYVPGFVEALLIRSAPPIVYDNDDAIFHAYELHRSALVRKMLGRKLVPLLSRVSAATCGNDYIKTYVQKYCQDCTVVPTVVNTDVYRTQEARRETGMPVRVGWIGSPSTWSYVAPLVPLLQKLVSEGRISFRAIGVGHRDRTVAEFEFIDWALETEALEVGQFDIGIMPLTDDPWSRGKCGYKLIQYMACGVPSVASPVGVNEKIVSHGDNGLLATNLSEWEGALRKLVDNRALRARLGIAGRKLVVEHYSLASQAPRVAAVLRTAAARRVGERVA